MLFQLPILLRPSTATALTKVIGMDRDDMSMSNVLHMSNTSIKGSVEESNVNLEL